MEMEEACVFTKEWRTQKMVSVMAGVKGFLTWLKKRDWKCNWLQNMN